MSNLRAWLWTLFILFSLGTLVVVLDNGGTPNKEGTPWYNLDSIHEHIESHIDDHGKLDQDFVELPDTQRKYEGDQIGWAPGAFDGVFGYHLSQEEAAEEVEKMADLIDSIAQTNNLDDKVKLYETLKKDELINVIDLVLDEIADRKMPVNPYLHDYARWLAFKGPDRGPVKFGISLLGVIGNKEDLEAVITLGKHEEFTLYSIVAANNILNDKEQYEAVLRRLGPLVEGWGRIHIIDRLAETTDPEIKQWMLEEGYKNSIMYEYTAYTVAETGGLKEWLSNESLTREQLTSAGDILQALIIGGPAENIDAYAGGAEATRLYVEKIEAMEQHFGDYLVLNSVKRFIENDEADWPSRAEKGWTDSLKSELILEINQILDDPKWPEFIEVQKDLVEDDEFYQLNQVASLLDIDLWESYWKRLNKDSSKTYLWYLATSKADSEQMDRLVEFALGDLPVNEMAIGPQDRSEIEDFTHHNKLDSMLQALRNFPGKGFELVELGLQNPVTRNRNLSIRLLSEWGEENWPDGTRDLIMNAEKMETNEDTKVDLNKLLNGEPLDD